MYVAMKYQFRVGVVAVAGMWGMAVFWLSGCSGGSDNPVASVAASYNEPYRPAYHFSPDSMWMNDPNGMVYFEGAYHLFYQHYPHGNTWGPMHWGHAVSTDLVHWEHLPIALYPDSLGYIFSGSAVIDWPNSTGLGTPEHPPMIAIFTHHNPELAKVGSDLAQYQSIAYSLDRGRSWTKYPGNPVLPNPGIRDFRDPKVFRYKPDGKWIMTLAAQDRVMFYSSPDLIEWTRESEFGGDAGAHGGVWECPDLFPLEINGTTKWVLLVSINPGGPSGGSATQYFVGEFDGHHFTNESGTDFPLWIDYGKDNYAGVTWSDIPKEDGRRIFIGWMSNWQYANQVPTEHWRNAMTLPRKLSLLEKEGRFLLISLPVKETELLRKTSTTVEPGEIGTGFDLIPPVETGDPLLELDLNFDPAPGTPWEETGDFGILLCNRKDSLRVTIDPAPGQVSIDRTGAGTDQFSSDFPGIHTAPIPEISGSIRLHAFIDRSSMELFINDGECVMTELFFPSTPYERVILFTEDPSIRLDKGEIHQLKSIWDRSPSSLQ
jgi:fructan beta-fructosidase